MRTKALLLAAAFAAAGISTSVAQVFSVNAVGYVNVTLDLGFNMVSNPLNAGTGNNTVAKLFSNITPSIPGGSQVFIFDTASGDYVSATYSSFTGVWGPEEAANRVILPGEGVFFRNLGNAPVTVTFVGEVMQGNLSNPLPLGFSIKANQVPEAKKPDEVGFPGTGGDTVFRYNKATRDYDTYTYSTFTGGWNPALPVIPVGEAFFVRRVNSAGSWNRTFSVNG